MVENMLWTFSKLNRQHLQNISFHLHKLRHLSPYSVSNCFYFYGRSKRLLLHPPIIIISTELQQTHIIQAAKLQQQQNQARRSVVSVCSHYAENYGYFMSNGVVTSTKTYLVILNNKTFMS